MFVYIHFLNNVQELKIGHAAYTHLCIALEIAFIPAKHWIGRIHFCFVCNVFDTNNYFIAKIVSYIASLFSSGNCCKHAPCNKCLLSNSRNSSPNIMHNGRCSNHLGTGRSSRLLFRAYHEYNVDVPNPSSFISWEAAGQNSSPVSLPAVQDQS